jgi:NAD(P)-dependent dehydrogenase (short-subunit alcohol dehydrogenase family)
MSNLYSLTGKVAIVTGASRGIGKATALLLGELRASVIVDYETAQHEGEEDRAREVVESIQAQGGQAAAISADIADPVQVDSLFDQTLATFGRVDIVVNNAAILVAGRVLDLTVTDWEKAFHVNTRGAFLVSQRAAREMMRQGSGGRIINITSQVAGFPIVERSAYSSSKAAIEAFTRCCALEWGQFGITVNAVAPGATRTSLNPNLPDPAFERRLASTIPMGRIAEPNQIAAAIAFLASDAASHITGQVIHVDGGDSMGRLAPIKAPPQENNS